MTASARKALERRQRRWADAAHAAYDERGFVRDRNANFFRPLAEATLAELTLGAELTPGRSTPARLWSLTSSAALVANVFDYWRDRDTTLLVAALGLDAGAAVLTFEEPLPTALAGDPPRCDVALRWPSGRLAAVESKFGEWLVRRPRHKTQLKAKYFPPATIGVWQAARRPRCQALAEAIQAGRERYRYLNAPQLLKHALGLAVNGHDDATLIYLYYDWPCREAAAHAAELERFTAALGAEVDFRVITYQSVFDALARAPQTEAAYSEYLERRYFARA